MSKVICHEVDLGNTPQLTTEQKARLEALAAMPDESIDYSDIPPLDDVFWQNARRNPFYKPIKMPTTVRVDADVLAWLKGQGKGYQTRINAILRDAMLRSLKAHAK